MFGRQPHPASSFSRTNPDGARSTYQGERVIANQLGRAFQGKAHRVVGIGSHRSELIRNPHDNARRIRPIRHQSAIVGQQEKLAVDAPARE